MKGKRDKQQIKSEKRETKEGINKERARERQRIKKREK